MAAPADRAHSRSMPNRPHFISEWAERAGMRQSDLAAAIGADKSIVSRWYHGASPSDYWQGRLSELFECEPESLFRHPDENWLWQFLEGRSLDEIERIKATLLAAFPKKPPV